ncbi:MAG: phosphatidylinositol kinase [Conexibacter sp.]|nr:phosphatidylinositol kinase [Conexibacter sp.]
MTSSAPGEAFAWIWLPGATAPVVAGRLTAVGAAVEFNYGRSYLERDDAIPLSLPELPLRRGAIAPLDGLRIAGCIADAGPDAWGQRVIMQHLLGAGATSADPVDLHPLTYLLQSGSDRIGALDFQASATTYVARDHTSAPLAELLEAADRVDQRLPLSPALDRALLHGSSVGGARPKALLAGGERKYIAKFSSTTDSFSVVKGEFVAMELARRAGLDVAPVELATAMGRDVLLVERFDRTPAGGRRAMISALTLLALDELLARYASYAELAEIVRRRFADAPGTLRELFARITFNILVGNTDDHARNHAAFWDGSALALTPAYDICPQGRAGGEAAQAMAIGPDGYRMSQLGGCVRAAPTYLLSEEQARAIIDHQLAVIEAEWDDVCDAGRLTAVDRDYFWRRQFLNPYALEGYGRAG